MNASQQKTISWTAAFFFLALGPVVSPVQAEGTPKDSLVTPKIGFSPFTGIVGLEVQHKHLALDLGIPLSGGIRYYFRPERHSWFAGLYGMGWGYDHDETKDSVPYTHYALITGGAAGGYRWLWRSRWSLELGLALGYQEQTWTNSTAKRWESSIALWPLAAFGIAF